jgi:hypothetical protein
MKTIRNILFICLCSSFIFSCSREKNESPAFSATGFWKENSIFGSVGILNRPDGTSRLYLMDKSDTATALRKYDGVYTVHGETYHFRTMANREGIDISLETSRNPSGYMTGMLSTRSYKQLAASIPF